MWFVCTQYTNKYLKWDGSSILVWYCLFILITQTYSMRYITFICYFRKIQKLTNKNNNELTKWQDTFEKLLILIFVLNNIVCYFIILNTGASTYLKCHPNAAGKSTTYSKYLFCLWPGRNAFIWEHIDFWLSMSPHIITCAIHSLCDHNQFSKRQMIRQRSAHEMTYPINKHNNNIARIVWNRHKYTL